MVMSLFQENFILKKQVVNQIWFKGYSLLNPVLVCLKLK